MKIELEQNNKVFVFEGSNKWELHPIWLRERVSEKEHLDKNTEQRLFDPSFLKDIKINKVNIIDKLLDIEFSDGVKSKIEIDKIEKEFNSDVFLKDLIKPVLWDSNLKDIKNFKFKDNFFESDEMLELLKSFYKNGFVVISNVPTKDNFIVKFANSIGSIRRTNFGEYFNVKSKPNPNDLAYTPLPLSPHTDNPYRKPIPNIQLLHCIENEVSGGYSTLVDGFSVAESLKKNQPNFFKILTEVKVKFRFVDKDVVLENEGQLIELDEDKKIKQVRFSTRLDFVPALEKERLDLYYQARNKISEIYNSDKFLIKFKLMPGDLLMMDNYRLLHGRTEFNPNEGNRFLQGCYIDYDSSEGKLRHLLRKFI